MPRIELFHVPFHLRHKVGQDRYGIPGFPCLYLGSWLSLCLAELRFNLTNAPQCSVARFRLRREIRLLDFGYKPGAWAPFAAHSASPALDNLIVNYAICWPLIAASSIKTLNEGAHFSPEYLVPQMILQWLMQQDIFDGIRYFSTRFQPEVNDPRIVNYVFPAVQGSDPKSHSSAKLEGLFALTGPVSDPKSDYSARLEEIFELTEPVLWGDCNPIGGSEAESVQKFLKSLPMMPLR